MRVASELRKTGLWVRQSTHYVDSDTGKSREIDVLATESDRTGLLDINFVVECKNSTKPWVLFTSPHTLTKFNSLFAFGVCSRAALAALANPSFEHLEKSLAWIRKDGRVGYNLTPAFTSGEDTAFNAAYGVTKAALFLMRKPEGRQPEPLVFAFPSIVIGSPLFECYLSEQGEMRIDEVTDGWLFFSARIPNFTGTCIRIVSEAGLKKYALEMTATRKKLHELTSDEVEHAWDAYKDRLSGKRKIRPTEDS